MMDIPLTIKRSQECLVKGEFSCLELTEECLRRIGEHNESLNLFLTIDSNGASTKAKNLDKLLKREGKEVLKKMPLLGSVVAHKDVFLTKGVKTTAGSKVLEDYIPQYSATVVERLESAGSIMIGKVNCDAWAHGSSGENSDYGPTKNPWNKDYVPGGSSSGSGAAVAAGMTTFATATDTCGSTRLPANFCGKVGLKPTYGAVSRYGIVAMASSLDCPGVIASGVSDVREVFAAVKGEDGKDSTVKPVVRNLGAKTNEKIKVGIPKDFFKEGVDREVSYTIDKAINVLHGDKLQFVDVSLPHTKYAIDAYYIIQPAEVSSNLSRYDGIKYGDRRSAFGSEAKRRIMLGTYVLSSGYRDEYYLKAMKVRSLIIKELDEVFKRVDVLIAPVAPTPPFKLGEKAQDPLKMYLTDIFAATANLAGIPALALPFGFAENGLPLGFQLMGPRFSEDMLFGLGSRFEKLTDYQPKFAYNYV